MSVLLALDQGTTSTRAIAFDAALQPIATAQRELEQHFPAPGWVEHDAERIWADTLAVLREAHAAAGGGPVAGIGITNQRETTVLWERATLRPLGRAIVWQDRRTAPACAPCAPAGHELWSPPAPACCSTLLQRHQARLAARRDAWRARGGGARALASARSTPGCCTASPKGASTPPTPPTPPAPCCATSAPANGTRSCWTCSASRAPACPRSATAQPSSASPRHSAARRRSAGMAGDQQAATLGQACFAPGMIKSTYGTGCFALLVTGEEPVASRHRLLTTIAWQLDGRRAYALEGSIFSAGATVQWLATASASSPMPMRPASGPREPIRRSAWPWCRPSPG
jgi:glycerol kinase